MAVLIGMSVEVKGKNFTLENEDLTIGRSSDNVISINNATVSGHHCKIFRSGEKFVLKDLGSTNGTRVNSKDITEVTLKPKDLVQVGSIEFLFNSDEIVEEADSPTYTETEVVESKEVVEAPESFESISPFGARRRETPGLWMILIVLLAILAVGGLGYLVYTLTTI